MEKMKIVAFRLGDEEYGLDIQFVQSIERIQPITRVPNAPEFVEGVINLRGNVTPVLDLRKRLNLEKEGHTEHTRVIITKFEEIELGLIVDKISDVIDLDKESIEAVSSSRIQSDNFEGIAKTEGRLIVLLKLSELIKIPGK
ncbi:chemotaxis protein CheW [Neobacillus mesonae]|uniref:chemotaxis protein CheW n=1 Tax=Neobacillus mesonae TaxID=1193713 RepID=UPI00203C3A99|nr:chemotaxis protein CheW [Neobacillus mesonae]MCM3566989.1 chemotaxis protein CheW [Neobacillus mesonae]